jgi:hypothetical protein
VFIHQSKNIFPDLPEKTNLLFKPQSNEGLAFSITFSLVKNIRSTGILTCYPSFTPHGLNLGPTNPWMTDIAMETLGIRRAGFSPALRYSSQHSHFYALQQPLQVTFTAMSRVLIEHA